MNVSDLRLLWDYNYWANARILNMAQRVTDVQYGAPMPKGFSSGSLSATLAHVLAAERIWLRRCRDGVAPARLFEVGGDFPTLAALRAAWHEEEGAMRAYLNGLSEADPPRMIEYARSTGEALRNPLEHILTHVVFHGMQHRAECAAMLTDFGHSPGNIDYIAYLRETQR